MWRHITGVEQPAIKIKLDNNEKLKRKRTYAQIKRKRKFQTSWQKKRNWLVHNSEIDRMTCSVCIQYASSDIDKKADFVTTGSSNLKLEFVISHETSEQHLRSVGKQSVKENSSVNSAAAKIVQSLNKNVFNRMTNLFRNVHALIKKDVHSQTLYECMNLMKLKVLTLGKHIEMKNRSLTLHITLLRLKNKN
jgi:hypothetical protein